MKKFQHGFSVIEVLISLGMVVLIVASIGTALAANNRLGQTGNAKDQALGFARESIETLTQQANMYFSCGTPNCWKVFNHNPYKIDSANNLVSGTETLTAGQVTFTRTINIKDLQRDASGVIVPSGNPDNFNSKEVTVTVAWSQNGQPKNVTLSTILTRWKNL
ncbi:MAG: hypothetical protein V1668_03080 [Patescibacteria group bacterium]